MVSVWNQVPVYLLAPKMLESREFQAWRVDSEPSFRAHRPWGPQACSPRAGSGTGRTGCQHTCGLWCTVPGPRGPQARVPGRPFVIQHPRCTLCGHRGGPCHGASACAQGLPGGLQKGPQRQMVALRPYCAEVL